MHSRPHMVGEHHHVCLVYDDPNDQLPVLVPYFQEGLLAGERCVWVLDDLSPDAAVHALGEARLDVAHHLKDGSLRLWTRADWRPQELVPTRRLSEVRGIVDEAVREGFRGIRFGIEMTWILGPDIPAAEVERWESTLDGLFDEPLPVRMICQYGRRRLATDVVQAGLKTHARAVLGNRMCANPFYEADRPAASVPERKDRQVGWMIEQLRRAGEEQARMERARRALDAQFAVTRVLADSVSIGDATPRILEAVCASIGWEVGAIWIVDPEADRVSCVDVHVAPGVDARNFATSSRGRSFPSGIGLPGRVWQTRGPVWVRDVTVDGNFPRQPEASADRLRGAFGFPIRSGSTITGVIEFFSMAPRDPDRELLAMLDALGSQIGQFVERRRTQERLELNERELTDFFEHAPQPLHWVGGDGRILRANQAEADMLGYTRAELVGRHIGELHEDPEASAAILRRLGAGETLVAEPARLRRKDGRVLDVLIDSNARFDEDGRFVHTRCFTRDVSARRRAEAALSEGEARLRELAASLERKVVERTAELQTANEQLVQFSYSASHDLRRPVRAIRGYIDVLREEYAARLDPVARDYLIRIATSTSRMDTLIGDLLAYSRMSRVELLHDRVDLDGAITEALAELDDEIRGARAVVTRERRSGRAAVRGHHATLVQVIANLVANAIKFVAPGVEPRVMVRLEPAGERVQVSVLDNGIGIEPAHRERIFRVFERLHPDDVYAGTGVGLAMVRKAMERLGGSVTCTGRPEGGSCFTIEVPVAPPTVRRDGPSFHVFSSSEPQRSGTPQA